MTSPSRFTTPRLIQGNRRAAPRLAPDQLKWLRRVRLTDGPAVSIIDLSLTGALFEIEAPLRPGDAAEFELLARHERTVVAGRVLRTEVSTLSAESLRYRGACEFFQPLPWAHRMSGGTPAAPAPRIAAPVDYQPWPGWHEVRLTFVHGRVLHGYTRGFHSSQSALDLWPSCAASSRARQTIPLSLLRKIVFVRPIDEDGSVPAVAPPHRLQAVEVTFRNNDVIEGAAPGYSDDDGGVWVFPLGAAAHPGVFAVGSAVRAIRFF